MINTLTTNTISTAAGYNGVSSTYTISPPSYNMGDNILTVNGSDASLTVKGKVIVNGIDLEERLEIIERVLGIPERDATIEAKYPSIKKKFDEYINSLEKYRTFDRIKGNDDEQR
jgi:hypothetical protein